MYVKVKETKVAKNNNKYTNLVLMDREGDITAKLWREDNSFKQGDVVEIKAKKYDYKGIKQLNIESIKPITDYDTSQIFPTTDKNIRLMWLAVNNRIRSIKDDDIRKLLTNVYNNDNIKVHPASNSYHHAEVGGLLEHTVGVVDICSYMAIQYDLDMDILIAGALLHDIAKLDEIGQIPNNVYTKEGHLLGHIVMGVEMITKHAPEGMDKNKLLGIKHCIVGHHGVMEWGSPKLPSTVEAYVLHLADMLDSKVKIFKEHKDSGTVSHKLNRTVYNEIY